MTPDRIVQVAQNLECGPPEAAVAFAQMVARHCAELVEEFDRSPGGATAAAHIREQFRLD